MQGEREALVELKKALTPFAELAENFVGDDEDDLDYYVPSRLDRQKLVTVGWLRAAAKALDNHDRLGLTPSVAGGWRQALEAVLNTSGARGTYHALKYTEAVEVAEKLLSIPAPPGSADEFVVVPRVADRAMLDAAAAYHKAKGGDDMRLPGGFFWCELWAAMLSAAPTMEGGGS